jgi:hypothetical protein
VDGCLCVCVCVCVPRTWVHIFVRAHRNLEIEFLPLRECSVLLPYRDHLIRTAVGIFRENRTKHINMLTN